jgi:hypothetical protein
VLVFWDQRLVLLATPKCGSTAIAHALEALAVLSVQRPPGLKHTSVHRYHRFVGPYLAAASGERFTVAALMREPRDWLGSWYRYRRREAAVPPGNATHGMSFDAFVRAWCLDTPPPYATIGSQERFLRPRQGEGVDHLFRYEDIDRFVDFLENRLGCAIRLPVVNVSPAADLALSAEAETLMERKLAPDRAMYGAIGR